MSSTFVPPGGSAVPICQRCQTPLSAQEVICSKCGYQNVPTNTGSLQTQSPSGITSTPKKGLLQQYASQQAGQASTSSPQGPIPIPSTPSTQQPVYPTPPVQSGTNFASPPVQQSSTNYPALPTGSGSNFASFKPGSGQLPPPQSNPSVPSPFQQSGNSGSIAPQPGSNTNLSSFKPGNTQPPSSRPASGQLPSSRPASGQLLQPGQPIPTPFQQQVSAGYAAPQLPPGASQPHLPVHYALPPQARVTGAFSNVPGQMTAMNSRPMPSMPVPTPSMAHRAQFPSPAPRAPINAPQNESPNWARLAIIVVLLVVLASGGYLSYVKLSSGKSTHPRPHPISYQPKGTPLFSDDFASNTFGWNLQSDEGNFAATIGNGNLTLENNTHQLLWELLPGTHMYDNFQIAFDATLSDGDQNNGYGVYIRGSSNTNTDLANYYRFELYGDASYAFFKGSTDATGKTTDTKLINYTGSPFINKQGKLNHVLIIANGSKFTFLVNGQILKTFTDASYTTGSIAFFVSNLPNAKAGASAQFAKFAIYSATSK
jgi:Domain of Unknown Function (DUF1080)